VVKRDFQTTLKAYLDSGKISLPLFEMLQAFSLSYTTVHKNSHNTSQSHDELLHLYLDMVSEQASNPHSFPTVHQAVREPYDYYKFSMDFMRPLIDMKHSTVQSDTPLNEVEDLLQKGENVIFFANHQTEPDATFINILLEEKHPKLSQELIYVAGHRVTTDPMAIPFSLGCNLLTIWSKRHIDTPPEKKADKQSHNQRSMKALQRLLDEGGKSIYVAPSGGRDRSDENGHVDVAPFDPAAVEMFLLLARLAKKPTHIFPMALATFELLPPPQKILKELGEPRYAKFHPAHIYIGAEIPIPPLYEKFNSGDHREQREKRTAYIMDEVKNLYRKVYR
jgi:glycerol-3-phosphate O-acyltransferase